MDSRFRGNDSRRRWRGAVVGLGGIATGSHLPAFRATPALRARVEIVCAVDPRHAPAGAVDGLRVLPDLDALGSPAGVGVNFVDLATPSATHVALARAALGRGLHVLCEKPVATRRADALALAALAREAGRVLVPCHQYRFNPVWRRVGEWLRAGAIGRWHLIEVSVHRAGADPGQQGADEALPWRVRRADAGGGVLIDHGTHLLYTLLDLAGALPARVSAWTGRLAHAEYEVEDTAEVRLEYADAAGGRVARLFCTWADRRRETRVNVVGERGAIRWTDGLLTLERGGETETQDVSRELDKTAYAGWFARLFEEFVGVLDAGAGSEAAERALDDVVRVATVLEAAYASAARGAVVAVDAPARIY
ncbi:dehydrogenase [Gemmatimonadetes bacterium T265]|nr:dehydrogenase [Gemmatimonadetes bacterium T265]